MDYSSMVIHVVGRRLFWGKICEVALFLGNLYCDKFAILLVAHDMCLWVHMLIMLITCSNIYVLAINFFRLYSHPIDHHPHNHLASEVMFRNWEKRMTSEEHISPFPTLNWYHQLSWWEGPKRGGWFCSINLVGPPKSWEFTNPFPIKDLYKVYARLLYLMVDF